MDAGSDPEPRRPAHASRRSLPKGNEDRLAALARRLPPPGDEARRIIAADRRARFGRRLLGYGVLLLVVALGAGAVVQWVRPLPAPAVQVPASVRLPGTPPALPWPGTGEAALAVAGVGTLGQFHGTRAVPVAGLIDVLTAYVVLHAHPLSTGSEGPEITVSSDTVAADQAGAASQVSEIPVTAGEKLTELQALEGLLVDGGADMATLLADWDAGNVSTFVTRMQFVADALGMRSTHVTDPSGVDAGTTSTAEDLVRLGEAAMALPALRAIVSLGEASVPNTTVVYNLNFDLGRDGIVGIKTSSDPAAKGGYLVAAQQSVGGKSVTVVGAVLGQSGPIGPNTAAVDAGDALVKAAFASLHEFALFPTGGAVGRLVTPWGSTAPVVVTAPVSVLGWPGVDVRLTTRSRHLSVPVKKGVIVGTLRAGDGGQQVQVTLRTTGTVSSPNVRWRLTR